MALNASDYAINYDDERLQNIKTETNQEIADIENTYGDMIDNSDSFYENLSNTMQEQADKNAQIQQENTDFAIEKIEQQKEQARKDYTKEQSGAYVDWRKQSNQYGAEAEKMASAGLANTGYSESSQVSMYNTYQNRVAMAKESLDRLMLNYDNNIQEAILQNNAAIAEIYSNLATDQARLLLEGFQYKNQLIIDLVDKKTEIKNTGWQKEMDILNQMNAENAQRWEIDSYYDNQAWQTEQNELDRKHQAEQARINREFEAQQAELNRKHAIELEGIKDENEKKRIEQQHKNDMEKLKKQQEYALAQIDKEYEKKSQSSKITGSNSNGSGSLPKNYVVKKATTIGGNTAKVSNTTKSTTKSNTAAKELKVDMNSVLALGYGPISESQLSQLVDQGIVKQYVEGNKIKFKKVVKKTGLK